MKKIIVMLSLAMATSAFAGIAPSEDTMDFGIAAGDLNSKVFKVKADKYEYDVIAADLVEPACNSVKAIIWVNDDQLPGDSGGVAYRLNSNFSAITSVQKQGNSIVITGRQNTPEDCTKHVVKTFTVEYPGNGGELSVK